MMRFCFALAAGLLAATAVSADPPATTTGEQPTPTTVGPVTSSGPVVIGTAPVAQPGMVMTAPTTQPRRGLFGRLRNRGTTTATAPVITTTPAPTGGTVITTPGTTAPIVAPAPNAVPSPMPGGTSLYTPGTTVMPNGGVTGITPAGGQVMAGQPVTTAGYVMPATQQPTRRMGLLARLRNRY
jgi:hypothetical protein